MKPTLLYICLTCAVFFFAIRVFAQTPSTSVYDQLTTAFAGAQKIPDIDKAQGIWLGKCYPRTYDPTRITADQDAEAFITHWHWTPPPGSPIQPIDAYKFQIRPLTSATTSDWYAFLAQAGNLGTFEEYYDMDISPNTWGNLFSQPEIGTAQEADVRTDGTYLYVWIRAVTDAHWACYFSFNSLP